MAGSRQRYTREQVIAALEETKGMVFLAAKMLGCSHVTVYNYAKRYVSVKRAIDANRGEVVDAAEFKLYKAILAGEHWAVAFALKTIGKHRGYVEKQAIEHTVPGGIEVTHRFSEALKRAYDNDSTGSVSDNGSKSELPEGSD